MKIPSSVSKLLENKYVLYIVFFLAVTNIFGYMVMGNIKAVILFILIGYLVYCFNKNMVIVLLVPLIITSIFTAGGIMREGLTNSTDATQNKPATTSATTSATPVLDKNDKAKIKTAVATKIKPDIEHVIQETETETSNTPEGATSNTETSGMSTMYKKKNNRIDYASTVEDAYGDLNKILGGDGIKRLTEDTQKLMGQQMQLADAMKSMTPLLTQAKSLMSSFDMKNFGNITAMAKQFGASE